MGFPILTQKLVQYVCLSGFCCFQCIVPKLHGNVACSTSIFAALVADCVTDPICWHFTIDRGMASIVLHNKSLI